MRLAFLIFLVVLLGGALLIGCAAPTPPTAPTICMSHNLAWSAGLWRAEAQKRLVNPIIVLCHGGTFNDQWMLCPDTGEEIPVEGAALTLKQIYPNRNILFVTCNEQGKLLHVGGCFYARATVFNPPGGKVGGQRRWGDYGVATIWDFEEGRRE